MKPLISVIMPVYNVDILLKKSIDSIINQTYKNLEIILVDDGSTDSSGVICDEYKKNDERIKVIHKENGGQALARNIALNVAKGDYYYFIDSDDEAKANSIETLLDLALENNADIVIADVDVIDENGNLLNDGKGQYSIIDNKIFTAEEAAYAFAKSIDVLKSYGTGVSLWGLVSNEDREKFKKSGLVKIIAGNSHFMIHAFYEEMNIPREWKITRSDLDF